jgi:hypothetical protein
MPNFLDSFIVTVFRPDATGEAHFGLSRAGAWKLIETMQREKRPVFLTVDRLRMAAKDQAERRQVWSWTHPRFEEEAYDQLMPEVDSTGRLEYQMFLTACQ